MTRQNFRTIWLWIGLALLMAATWTTGTASHWLLRGSIAAIGGLVFVDWSWRKPQ